MFVSALRNPLRTLFQGALLVSALSTAGCADDPGPGKLFEEDGVWELTTFALSGTGTEELASSRKKDFLMKFDGQNSVVQVAMCSNDDIDDPTNAECDGFTDSMWICQCFGYGFEEDQMAWQAFEAGSMPPVVKVGQTDEADAGEEGGDGDTDTDGGSDDGGDEEVPPPSAGGVHQLTVTELASTGSTYDFTPLPAGVFGSDGVASKYIFQKKAASVFDIVLEDPERPSCQPCI